MTTGSPRKPRLLAGAVAAVASSVPVVLLALVVRNAADPVVRWDQRVVGAVSGLALQNPWLRTAAEVGVYVLHPVVFRVAVAVAVVLLWRRGARSAALWAASTMVVGSVLGFVLKVLVSRARPVLDNPVSAASGFSFPSGHALNAALGVTLLLVLAWRPLERRGRRAVALAAGLLVVALTNLDRLLLGVHFPTDVLAGSVVGALVVASSWVAFGPVLREAARRGAERTVEEVAAGHDGPDPRVPARDHTRHRRPR